MYTEICHRLAVHAALGTDKGEEEEEKLLARNL